MRSTAVVAVLLTAQGCGSPPAQPQRKPIPELSRGNEKCIPPAYPPAALRADVMGTTRLRFELDESGAVVNSTVVTSAGPTELHKLLDQAAVEALGKCHFKPAKVPDGQPQKPAATVEYRWKIEPASYK